MALFSKNLSKLIVGISWSITGKFLGRFLSVLGDVVVARILGPSVFGLYSIGWTLLRMCSLVVHLGLPNGVQRFIPLYINNDSIHAHRIIKQSIIISTLSGILFSLTLYILSPFIANEIYHKPDLVIIFRLFGLSLPFISILSTTVAITRATHMMNYSVLIEDIGQPFFGLVFLGIVYFTVGALVNWVIFSDLLSFVIASILGFWAAKKLFSGFLTISMQSLSALRELMVFSIPTALAGTFAVFVFWVDRLLVGYFLSESENGLYQAASQLSVLFVIVLSAFNSILAPMFSSFYAMKDIQQINEIFRVGTKWGLYLCLPVFLVFCFAPTELLSFIYGPAYSGAWMALVVLSVGQIINVGTGSIGSLLSMTGNHRLWLFLSILGMILNIIMCVFLIPSFGITGAAMGTTISLNVMYFSGLLWARNKMGVWPYDDRYLKGFVSFGCTMLVLFGFERIYSGNGFIFLSLLSLLSLITFFGVLIMLGLEDEDKHIINVLFSYRNKPN